MLLKQYFGLEIGIKNVSTMSEERKITFVFMNTANYLLTYAQLLTSITYTAKITFHIVPAKWWLKWPIYVWSTFLCLVFVKLLKGVDSSGTHYRWHGPCNRYPMYVLPVGRKRNFFLRMSFFRLSKVTDFVVDLFCR